MRVPYQGSGRPWTTLHRRLLAPATDGTQGVLCELGIISPHFSRHSTQSEIAKTGNGLMKLISEDAYR